MILCVLMSQSSDDSLCKSSSPLCANGKGQHQEYEGAFQPMVKNTAVSLKAKANQLNIVPIEINDDVVMPETPGMQPLASHAK
ncbi:hypothetical protein Ahy_B05g074907 [Arachis hypogaea]|uniref:Uncharacterized protein n=1 Tax=Arachis hypogaea TaxID=3818 RepID=A0A444Z0F6_ARAHY|nr:hypothetical protein Ahy_B05g074907 [Arachis hypogaea]